MQNSAARLIRCNSVLRQYTGSKPRSFWPSPPSPPSRFPVSDVRTIRLFSSYSPQQYASEAPNSPWQEKGWQDPSSLFDRLQQHPQVLDAIEELAKTVKAKTNVDLQAGEKPTMTMMMKLASDPELRAAAENLMMQLKAAGVEVDPKAAFAALQAFGGSGFESTNGLNGLQEMIRKGEGNKGDGEDGEGSGKAGQAP